MSEDKKQKLIDDLENIISTGEEACGGVDLDCAVQEVNIEDGYIRVDFHLNDDKELFSF